MKKTQYGILVLLVLVATWFFCTENETAQQTMIGWERLVCSESEAFFCITASVIQKSASPLDSLAAVTQWNLYADTDSIKMKSKETTFMFHITNDEIHFAFGEISEHSAIYPTSNATFLSSGPGEKRNCTYEFSNGGFALVDKSRNEIYENDNLSYTEFLKLGGWSYERPDSPKRQGVTIETCAIRGTNAAIAITAIESLSNKGDELGKMIKVTSPNGSELILTINLNGKWNLVDSGDEILQSGVLPFLADEE